MRYAPARLLGALLVAAAANAADDGWRLERPAIRFDRCELATPNFVSGADLLDRVKTSGLIAGYREGEGWNPVTGWFDYDVQVPADGWYRLSVPAEIWQMEYLVDGELIPGWTTGGVVQNLWLGAGHHVVRLQKWNCGGFQPALTRWVLAATGADPAEHLRLRLADGRAIVRLGEAVQALVDGGPEAVRAEARLTDPTTHEVVARAPIAIAAGTKPSSATATLTAPRAGVFELSLALGDRRVDDAHPLEIVVVDATPAKRGGELATTTLSEIDCVATEPDFAGNGGSHIASGPTGKFRESGEEGFLYAQHHGEDASWFAYAFTVPEAGKPYVLEAECPDDAFRTFLVCVRDANPDAYPPCGGLDTGGCWTTSNALQKQRILFWPRSTDLRALFLTAHDGRRGAACAKIRILRVDGDIPPMDLPAGGRSFANWYEEGDNFLAMYGGDRDHAAMAREADRWARAAANRGVDTLIDTVAVYQMGMYPSQYNRCHVSSGTFDLVRLVTLACERYGLGFVGEFHPECRDLDHLGDPAFTGKPRTNYLVNKDGATKEKMDAWPKFHPLDPVNQAWLIGMVGEFADRYRDSPALRGVSLRAMSWQNPALNNFHDLDWGYDDLTVGMFERETGLSTGAKADDPHRFRARYDWLMAHARERWIEWRCAKIAELYAKLRDRVRASRDDLRLYTDVFDRPEIGVEAGFDGKRLAAIDGVVVLDARMPYGRQGFTYDGPMGDARRRDLVLDPDRFGAMRRPDGCGSFLFYSCYFEGTDIVVPPPSLGYPASTRRTWVSGVVNPAGRHELERYAHALAETDAVFLGDGGNAYTLGQPIVREFMAEYRRLPPVAFAPRADARDPVAVRELAKPDGLLFYAVNRERYPVKLTFAITGAKAVRRVSSGASLAVADGKLALELLPYQLIVCSAPAGAAIAQVAETPPAQERERVAAMVDAAVALADDARAGRTTIGDEGKALIDAAATQAKQALAEGRLWRARTALESSRLAELAYAPALRFPPGLEFLAEPRVAALIQARAKPRPADAAVIAELDRVAGATTPLGGRAKATAAVEGGATIGDGRAGGKAMRFDGAGGAVRVRGAALGAGGRTIALWMAPDDVGGRRGLASVGGCDLFLWNGSIVAEAGDGPARATCRTADSFVAPGAWHHVAAVYAPADDIALYLDGIEVKRVPFAGALAAGTSELALGWNGWGGRQDDPSPGWFAGRLAGARVFDRALSADEVLVEWSAGEHGAPAR